MTHLIRPVAMVAALLTLTACEQPSDAKFKPASETTVAEAPAATVQGVEEAREFVAASETTLERLAQHHERVSWVLANFITDDTELLAAKSAEQFTLAQVAVAAEAARFNGLEGLDYDTARKLNMLKSGIVIPAPMDPEKTAEQSEIGANLKGMYGRGSYCREDGGCLALG
ncbi:M2 family metallopeptidase, partial [Pseudomonadota bacterium]